MSDTDLTRDDLVEIISYVPNLSFIHGNSLINLILAKQKEKQNIDPASAYARCRDSDSAHTWLTDFAKNDPRVRAWVEEKKKIQAIQEIRNLTHAQLKQAKDAIEAAYPEINYNF